MIDTASIVFPEEAKADPVAGGAPPKEAQARVINPPVDYDSITFEESQPAPRKNLIQQLDEAFTPGFVVQHGLNPIALAAKVGQSDGRQELENIRFLPLDDDKDKARDSEILSQATGLPRKDIEDNYDALKFVYNFATRGPAAAGADIGARTSPITVEGLVNATMKPTLIAGAVFAPWATAAGLAAFTALDHMFPTEQFIPEEATEEQAASIRLVGMLVKGAVVGGLFKGARAVREGVNAKISGNIFEEQVADENMGQLMEIFTAKRLQEMGLPDSYEITPYQLQRLAEMKTPTLAQAEIKRTVRAEKLRAQTVENLKTRLLDGEVINEGFDPQILRDAKIEAIAHIDNIRATEGKVRNKFQQIRYDLRRELLEDVHILDDLGIKPEVAESAIKNNLSVKVPAEKLVKVAVKSEAEFARVEEILTTAEPPAAAATAAPGKTKMVEKPVVKPVKGTGDTRTSGLAKGVEAKAVENKLVKDFGDLPEFQEVKMEVQAQAAADIIARDYELAKRIALGQEPPPKDVLPESLFVAVEAKALAERDVNTLRDLATKSKLVGEATTMGQRIRTLAERNPDSPLYAMKEIVKAREVKAQERLGSKKITQAKSEAAAEIKVKLKEAAPKLSEWEKFIKSLEC